MAANPSTSDATPGEKPLWRLALGWLGRVIWSNKFAMLLAIAGIVSLLATMFIVTRRGAVEAEAETVLWLLVLNLVSGVIFVALGLKGYWDDRSRWFSMGGISLAVVLAMVIARAVQRRDSGRIREPGDSVSH